MPRYLSEIEDDLTKEEQDAENVGRAIGIALHWVFVKPFQIVFWFFANIQAIIVSVQLLYVLGVLGLLFWLAWRVW